MNTKIKRFKSIRTKLFISLCVIVVAIIVALIILNNFVLRHFYEYTKEKQLESLYFRINNYYNTEDSQKNLEEELDKISISNNFDILIIDDENHSVWQI